VNKNKMSEGETHVNLSICSSFNVTIFQVLDIDRYFVGIPQTQTLYVKGELVMVSELGDKHGAIAYLVDEAMLIIDTPRPVAR